LYRSLFICFVQSIRKTNQFLRKSPMFFKRNYLRMAESAAPTSDKKQERHARIGSRHVFPIF